MTSPRQESFELFVPPGMRKTLLALGIKEGDVVGLSQGLAEIRFSAYMPEERVKPSAPREAFWRAARGRRERRR